jgi:hypothetical protein
VLEHLEPQAPFCMFTADGRPAVDFIGRSEEFAEDLQGLLELLNERRPPGMAPLRVQNVPRLNVRLTRCACACCAPSCSFPGPGHQTCSGSA